jgi:hypothetical protein
MRRLILLLLFLCTACGYHFEDETFAPRYSTISVPFVQGDWDGNLTAAIVEQIGRTGCYRYQSSGGALTLQVQILDFDDRNIGFRYDRDRKGHLRHTIIPTETRLTASVEVSLIDAASQTTLLGPVCLTAWVDFDHDYESPLNSVNIFSLGQLNDYDAAYDAVYRPLNRALSQKIVDFICDSW